MDFSISRCEADDPALPWDTVWDTDEGLGDWRIATARTDPNAGGLVARQSIPTAVLLSLFQDRRAPAGWRPDTADRRGWWGDSVAADGEAADEDGSWLWLLDNESVSDSLPVRGKQYAEQALAWMLSEKVAGKVSVTSGLLDAAQGWWLCVDIFARSGEQVYSQRFDRLWRDVARSVRMS